MAQQLLVLALTESWVWFLAPTPWLTTLIPEDLMPFSDLCRQACGAHNPKHFFASRSDYNQTYTLYSQNIEFYVLQNDTMETFRVSEQSYRNVVSLLNC